MVDLFRRKLIITFLILVVGTGSSLNEVSAQPGSRIYAQMDQLLLQHPDLKGAIAGISLRSARTGEILYQQNGDVRLKPASNLKLLTGAAALSVLGQGYRFKTEVFKEGSVKKGILKGNLYLKGKGDPTLLKADFDNMAKQIRKAGINTIKGDIIGDDTWYDNVRYSLDLPWSDEQTYYGAQISALTASPNKDYDAGTVIAEVEPGQKIGAPGRIKLKPRSNYIKLVNQVETVSQDGKKEINFEREHGANTVTVKGTIPVDSGLEREWLGVWEPTRFALDLFKQSLKKNGVKWKSGSLKTGKTPEHAQLLYTHQSMSLSELMVPFMKLSNNGHAEILIKEMGKVVKGEGSWEKGLEVLEEELQVFGLNSDTVVLRDGSGISHADLVPANEISKLLFVIQKEKWFPAFLHSLPVSGDTTKNGGGTLRKRMNAPSLAGKIRAKTGTISTVSSLSGYIKTNSGETLIFSILLNNLMDESKGKAVEDQIVSIMMGEK
ncbi:D-alanyl-D-alanine carboxypeptidase/D-alanyl-D-alanine endopeptidase [Neobacillus sp. LXY-4]|uniref:D-alanyl-D-alanine carboxypeptidase/D-alanyl-D-alanine endopeptidase n=1 Tax=Neobacillus sp. LXY-4 TaxID=3379826 RepID=UPI003EE1CEA0